MRLFWALSIVSAELNINNFSNGHYTEESCRLSPEKEPPVLTGKEAVCFLFRSGRVEERIASVGNLTKPLSFYVFVDRASRYIRVIKTNLMHCLSSVYFDNQPLHVSGIFVAHHQEVYCIYTTTGTCCAF